MNWPAIDAAAHRDAGDAETITISHLGVVETYPDSQAEIRSDRRTTDNGARVEYRFLQAFLPRGAGLAAPEETSTLTRGTGDHTVTSVTELKGSWRVEATP